MKNGHIFPSKVCHFQYHHKFLFSREMRNTRAWMKHVNHQNESLRAASLSKLDNTVNNNSISNTKYAEFSIKQQVVLHFHNSNCAYNHPYNLHQKSFLLLQSIFTSLFHPYVFTKSSLQSPLTLPSSIPQQFCTTIPTSFCAQPSHHSPPKLFFLPQSFSQFRLDQGTRDLGSLKRAATVLI